MPIPRFGVLDSSPSNILTWEGETESEYWRKKEERRMKKEEERNNIQNTGEHNDPSLTLYGEVTLG